MTNSDLPSQIVFYATEWCWQCKQSRHILDQRGIPYLYIDIDSDNEAAKQVMEMNGGYRSVPTIVFPGGTYLVEPSPETLTEHLDRLSA